MIQNDPAGRELLGRERSKTVKLAYFTTTRNATWAADRGLLAEGYPLATVDLPANRNAVKLEPGDQIRWNYPQWGISNMVLRILRITEENLDKGDITLHCVEDVDHICAEAFGTAATGLAEVEAETLQALIQVDVVEAPYVLAGDTVKVIPLGAKALGTELGYYLYMSIDGGASYQKVATIPAFALYGTLVEPYSADTYRIDEQTDGMLVDFDLARTEDLGAIQSITRSQMISGQNVALVGNEIITFKDVTPVTSTRFRVIGIFRGRYDTQRQDHSAGTAFWYVGDAFNLAAHAELIIGASRKFKLLPYTTKRAGDISEASVVAVTIAGRGQKPHRPGNLMVNGSSVGRYSTDIVLTWTNRVRGEGAGHGDPNTVTDAAPTWEYVYEVEVWVGGVLKRTASSINDDTWTYTQAMNEADNGALADAVTFKVRQVRTADYLESDPEQITVSKE